ncbi:hypothetical protein ISS30_09705 [bacterium]|nr:hypothetical protein [bacterium]
MRRRRTLKHENDFRLWTLDFWKPGFSETGEYWQVTLAFPQARPDATIKLYVVSTAESRHHSELNPGP